MCIEAELGGLDGGGEVCSDRLVIQCFTCWPDLNKGPLNKVATCSAKIVNMQSIGSTRIQKSKRHDCREFQKANISRKVVELLTVWVGYNNRRQSACPLWRCSEFYGIGHKAQR